MWIRIQKIRICRLKCDGSETLLVWIVRLIYNSTPLLALKKTESVYIKL